jgi:ABC-type polar amino acid transport system ATPase subunit
MIALRALRKAYGDRAVLGGVDAAVEAGDVVAIVGASGCGKSTLLRCMNALEQFDEGGVSIAGFELAPGERPTADLVRLRSTVGMVFQEFHLFPHLTAKGNVALAQRLVLNVPRATADSRAVELLRDVGLEARADAYPAQLSGGEKQRVAIARALALPLKVLLLDEPTSALDPRMREEVRAVLRAIAAKTNLTMLLVTHEMRLARELAKTVWVMKGGVIAARGAPDELLRDGGVARELLGVGDD